MLRGWLTLLIALAGCASLPETGDMPAQESASKLVEEYRIGVDDMVQVSVWRNDDLSVTVPVRPDGRISVPLIGDLEVGGKTPDQVAAEIREALSTYLKDPLVAVILTEVNSDEYLSRIRVTGAVRNQITIPYRQGITVLDAVLAAGGPNEFAAAERSRLYRTVGDDVKTYPVALNSILNKGDLRTNYSLRPGDVITVPERTL